MSETSTNEVNRSLFFGDALLTSRKQQNLSLEDISKAIHLTPEMIDAMDRSDVGALPEPAFVQGYLRIYARFLGVDELAVLEDYSNSVPHSLESELKRRSVLPREADSGSPFVKSISIILLLLASLAIAYGAYSYYSEMIDTKETSDEQSTDELFLPSYESNTEPVSNAEIEMPVTTAEDAGDNILNQNIENEDVAVETLNVNADEKTSEVVLTDGHSAIHIVAKESSWVEIVDDNKLVLHYDLLKKNQSLSVSGVAPFKVFLGNATGVDLTLNNIEVDVKPFVRRNKTAQFKLSNDDQKIVFH